MPRRIPRGPPDPVPTVPLTCLLCARPLGRKVEWHHLVPKSRGGKETAPIHPVCHRTVHATLTNKQLERDYDDAAMLRAEPTLAAFIAWVADKPADFTTPVRRASARERDWKRAVRREP